ncbi:MAG: uridine phosphorylase [Chloroflexi bacterium RBG_16_48_8]|nr:MAG: uridine phosphorylase [Chloroflexi bacterium RBG_16_48_8]
MKEEIFQYHIQLKKGDVGRYILLPGDPGRCEKIAAFFDSPQFVAQNREYTTYTGSLLGEMVSVVSTGIGGPSTAIAVEELIKIGADTFIRVGTSGGIQPDTKTGDIAIVTAAIRDEGTSRQYLPIEFPAVADVDVVLALREAAVKLELPYQIGVTQSKDSFYGEIEMDRMPVSDQLHKRWKAWVEGGAICSEMESAAIFILSSIHRKRAGGVMMMVGAGSGLPKTEEEKVLFHGDRAIRTAIEAVKILIEKDRGAR